MAGYQRQRAEYLDQLSRYQAAVRHKSRSPRVLSRLGDGAAGAEEGVHPPTDRRALPEVYFPPPDPHQFPPDPFGSSEWGAVAAFFERAFEWEHLINLYYPYFWGRKPRWGELILTSGPRPAVRGLPSRRRSQCRHPGRPGFEAALAHYHETGDVWTGEEIPDMFSIVRVDHRGDQGPQRGAGRGGVRRRVGGAAAETLVTLKDDAKLPEWTPEKECTPPVDESRAGQRQ